MQDLAQEWDADRTRSTAIAPLLTVLGYRRADQQPIPSAHGRRAILLAVGGSPSILLEGFRAGHMLNDVDAKPSLLRAKVNGVAWVVLTNGWEVRVYTANVAAGADDPSGALVFRVNLFDWADEGDRLESASMLWLLSREAIRRQALDAYLAARAVGAALLASFDDPDSNLLRALGAAVESTTGLQLSTSTLARQARLAVRGARGRDGEPDPEDIVSVALAGGEHGPIPAEQETRLLA
jgi:hypothetical protein